MRKRILVCVDPGGWAIQTFGVDEVLGQSYYLLWGIYHASAQRYFMREKDRLFAIIMDSSLDDTFGLGCKTEGLVFWMRENGFVGPIIAYSCFKEHNEVLMRAGCTVACQGRKEELSGILASFEH